MMSAHNKQAFGGYVLVSTIWVLAFLTIAAASIGEWYTRSLSVAGMRSDNAYARIEGLSTRATLLYKIATADMGSSGIFLTDAEDPAPSRSTDGMDFQVRQGIPDIIFDGAVYRGYGSLRFSIQDESGLWGLVPEQPERTRALLMSRGVEFERAQALAVRLADYTDEDDLVRLDGAEAPDYLREGLPPPPNRRPQSVGELKSVLGWADEKVLWQGNALPSLVTLYWGPAPNPGTAPREVLLEMPGATPELVEMMLAARRGEGSFEGEVSDWVNSLMRSDVFTTFPRPSYNMRLRFWRDGERQLKEYFVRFSGGDQDPAPWTIETNYRLPISRDLKRETARTAKLPAFVL